MTRILSSLGLRHLSSLVALLTILFLIGPVLLVFPMSFSASEYLTFPPKSFSLRWYEEVLTSPRWQRPMWFSLKIAFWVAVFSSIVGTPAAYALNRGNFPGKQYVQMLVIAPVIVPNIVIALSVYFYFSDLRMIGSLWAFVLAHSLISIPFVVLTVNASLQRFDVWLELAALSCGASRLKAFFLITLPNIWPGVAAGGAFSFITSFDEAVISYFISSVRQTTLPRMMMQNIEAQVKPDIAAIGAILIAVSAAVALFSLVRKQRTKA